MDIHSNRILILDFGSQYTQLIARRIREQKVYCEIHPYNIGIEAVRAFAPRGIILSGGPSSIFEKGAPLIGRDIFDLGVPVLGICYGMQMTAHLLKGRVEGSPSREYGRAELVVDDDSDLFKGVVRRGKRTSTVWMSHGDRIDC
ncbi:MAG: GMP synthase (glutamine-hydrolyzing), partial [Deltaproteobacteria bacterium]|nr:GMP synthase (glutamine-hydrolyzing) [Deltaproteobacteria bacterium]